MPSLYNGLFKLSALSRSLIFVTMSSYPSDADDTILNDTNYDLWKDTMQKRLGQNGLWRVIASGYKSDTAPTCPRLVYRLP